MSSVGLFGYGSLVLHESASMTLGRPAGKLRPVLLHDWRRRFSQRRDNLTCEKTFECDGGWRPEWILGLNVEEGEDQAGRLRDADHHGGPATPRERAAEEVGRAP